MRHLVLPFICSSLVFANQAQALVEPGDGAAPIPPPREVRLVSTEFPVGGAIVGFVECYNCVAGEQPVFMDSSGQTLAGTFQVPPSEVGEAFVWLPAEPLALGSYSASLPDGYQNTAFEVVAASSTDPTLGSQIMENEYGEGDAVSCLEYDSASDYTVYYPETMKQGTLLLEIEGEWTQFFYSVTFDDKALFAFTGANFTRSYIEPVATCYEVTATPVLGGDPQVVGEGCIEASESSEWGPQGLGVGSLERVLAECTEPPGEHFDAWCDQFEDAADSDACGEACVAAQVRCSEGLDPEEPNMLEGSGGSTDSTGGTGSTNQGSREVSGCTVSGTPPTSAATWAWGGIFFLALALRRRSLTL
jgi:MYXO-CTERM domain-containing protein